MKLYITPPSILTLVTWVPQSRLAFAMEHEIINETCCIQCLSYSCFLVFLFVYKVTPSHTDMQNVTLFEQTCFQTKIFKLDIHVSLLTFLPFYAHLSAN